MADVTGALHHEFAGRSYCLRLTLGGIANLQGRYGNDIDGMLSGKYDAKEGQRPPVPPFGILIDILTEALKRGEGMEAKEAAILADDMLTADQNLIQRVLAATFPDRGREGNGQARAAKS